MPPYIRVGIVKERLKEQIIKYRTNIGLSKKWLVLHEIHDEYIVKGIKSDQAAPLFSNLLKLWPRKEENGPEIRAP